VFIAVAQVGVVVLSSLGAAAGHRVAESMGGTTHLPTLLLMHYWAAFLALPPVWASVGLWLRARHQVSNDIKAAGFWLGVLLLPPLVALGIAACFGPMFVTHGQIEASAE
jgi:hypothetical protein